MTLPGFSAGFSMTSGLSDKFTRAIRFRTPRLFYLSEIPRQCSPLDTQTGWSWYACVFCVLLSFKLARRATDPFWTN